MMRRIGIGALSYLVPTFALGFVWHLVAFKDYYDELAMYRHDVIIPFGFLTARSPAITRASPGEAGSLRRLAPCCRGASRRSPLPRRT